MTSHLDRYLWWKRSLTIGWHRPPLWRGDKAHLERLAWGVTNLSSSEENITELLSVYTYIRYSAQTFFTAMKPFSFFSLLYVLLFTSISRIWYRLPHTTEHNICALVKSFSASFHWPVGESHPVFTTSEPFSIPQDVFTLPLSHRSRSRRTKRHLHPKSK